MSTTANHDKPHSALKDRRSHRRFEVSRSGKVFRAANRQFIPIVSKDLSFGGALLEAETDRPFEKGETLDVGLALNNRAVVPSSGLLRGIVVRSEALGEHRQRVAVRYLHREGLQAAA
ncbi:MAG TPA: PilZ domain-containing protein [Phycisphaerales bacterium]|jgi:hypothetical protein|nr:PilZ domain-containing protein [Phycisphaerales bacterium]